MTPEQSFRLGRPIAGDALEQMAAVGLSPVQSFACFLVAVRSATGATVNEQVELSLASFLLWSAACLPLISDDDLRAGIEKVIADRAGLEVGPQFADQTSICIEATAALTDDRRKLLICGGARTLAFLRKSGPDRWRDAPPCFVPLADGSRIVGSFDGVPVSEIADPPSGLGFFLGGELVGGVFFSTLLEGFRSYHHEGGAQIDHPRAECGLH